MTTEAQERVIDAAARWHKARKRTEQMVDGYVAGHSVFQYGLMEAARVAGLALDDLLSACSVAFDG